MVEECQFFYKVGACRHGSKCVRRHSLPQESKAILVSMPAPLKRGRPTADLDQFVENVFVGVALIAPIEEICIASNDSPHLAGSVYIAFQNAGDAARVLTNINARWFDKEPIFASYLPSQSIAMAVCREGDACQRQLDCNYVHPFPVSGSLWTRLFTAQNNS